MNGPQVLYMPEEGWLKVIVVANEAKHRKECRKVQALFQVQNMLVMLHQAIDCKRFSKWRILIRVTAWVIRFTDNLKAKVIARTAESQTNATIKNDCPTPDELQKQDNCD